MRSYKMKTAPILLVLLASSACSAPESSNGPAVEAKQGALVSDAAANSAGLDPTRGASTAATPAGQSAAAPGLAAAPTQVKVGNGGVTSAVAPTIAEPLPSVVNAPPRAAGPVTADQPGKAALASLGTLSELVSQSDPKGRGFNSTTEARGAALGTPLQVYMVGLNDLRAYQSGKNPKSLLLDKKEVVYPIIASGDVRSSVVVRQRPDNSWEAVQFGRGATFKDVETARANVSAKRALSKGALSLIEIPTLAALFLAHDEGGSLWLSPVSDVSGTTLRAQGNYLASEVFSALQPIAANVGPGNQ